MHNEINAISDGLCEEKERLFINEIKVQFVVNTMCHQHHVKHGEEFQRSKRERSC